tara:strand:- start:165 stop:494 length:330 start_codon:yes stop_codon:yes gene_type:complete
MSGLATRLNRRVTLEQPVRSSDGAGGASISWSLLATVWAEVRSRGGSGAESLLTGALVDDHRIEVTIRYRRDVTAAMRVVIAGETYQIQSVENVDAAGVTLRLLVERSA